MTSPALTEWPIFARRFAAGLIVGALVAYVAVTLALPTSHPVWAFFRAYVHCGLMVAAAVVAVGVAARADHERLAWGITSFGLVAFAGGELVWLIAYADQPSPPHPSWADVLWLSTYPAFYVGLMLLVRGRVAHFSPGAWLDGLIASTAVAAIAVAFYLEPVLESTGGDPVAIAITMAYPLGDVLLWSLLLASLALSGWRVPRSFALLAVGQICITVGDAAFAVQTAQGLSSEGVATDMLWPTGALLIAMAGLTPRRPTRIQPLTGWRSVAVPATLVAVTAVMHLLDPVLELSPWAAGLTSLTLLLVLARAALAMRENFSLVARLQAEANTDALTGLGNRRALLADLQWSLEEGSEHTLALFDLDGFKQFNDAYGHTAGDELLARLGASLRATVAPGRCYRLGGDEFCLLAPLAGDEVRPVMAAATTALCEDSGRASISASCGAATLPAEAAGASAALRLVDSRMYAQKALRRVAGSRRASAEQTLGVLAAGKPAKPADATALRTG